MSNHTVWIDKKKKLRTQQLQISKVSSYWSRSEFTQQSPLLKEWLLSCFNKIEESPWVLDRTWLCHGVLPMSGAGHSCSAGGWRTAPQVGQKSAASLFRDTLCGSLCNCTPGVGEGSGTMLNWLGHTLEDQGIAGQGGGPHGRPPRGLWWWTFVWAFI